MQHLTGNNYADKEMIDRALSNDPAAFRSIMQQTERMVAQVIYKMVLDPEDRKDLAQETYLKAFRSLAKFKHEAKLSTWICQIAYNACLDHLRRQKLRPLLQRDLQDINEDDPDTGHFLGAQTGSGDTGSDTLVSKKQLSAILQTGIAGLSPVYRTLITLFHTEEMSYLEIGQITGLPEGTIKSYLSRARKTLRDLLLTNYSKSDL